MYASRHGVHQATMGYGVHQATMGCGVHQATMGYGVHQATMQNASDEIKKFPTSHLQHIRKTMTIVIPMSTY
jgi:hypothetical protein